ncbi:MAG: hypothetical protein WCA13_01200 [Terriglobales bacterium]
MPSNEQIIRSRYPKHLYSDQYGCYHDRMHAVYADTVHALKPRQSRTSLIHEARISTEVGNCTAGFHSTEDILLGQILVLH